MVNSLQEDTDRSILGVCTANDVLIRTHDTEAFFLSETILTSNSSKNILTGLSQFIPGDVVSINLMKLHCCPSVRATYSHSNPTVWYGRWETTKYRAKTLGVRARGSACNSLPRPEEGTILPGSGVRDWCEPLYSLELNLGPLEEQPVLLSPEPPAQQPYFCFEGGTKTV